jgi:DNA-binding MarR family transcriptional regulator
MDESIRPTSVPARIKDQPTWLISRAYARSSALLNDGFEANSDGLRGYHYRLLAALAEYGRASQADLGRGTGIDRSDVTAAVNDLADRQLIERAVDPADRRRNIVSITRKGTQRLGDLDQIIADVQAQVLAPLSSAEQRQFLKIMRRLADPSDHDARTRRP